MGGPGDPGIQPQLDDHGSSRQHAAPGTFRRALPYAKKFRWSMALAVIVTAVDAVIVVANPLLLRAIIDDGILPHRITILVTLSMATAGLAVLDALAQYLQGWCSARVGQGLVLALRTQVFDHVQRQSLTFFTRSQTGSLVSRLNTDVAGAQQAVTTLITESVSAVLTLVMVLIAMAFLSWQITVIILAIIPLAVLPGRMISRGLERLARQEMQLDAELGSMMSERFNVAGAMLSKLYGRPGQEAALFASSARRVRDISVATTVYSQAFFTAIATLATFITALVYGLGGSLVISGALKLGTIIALVALLSRLYVPINQAAGLQIDLATALVSFDRIFEVIDLKPLISEHVGASSLPGNGVAPDIEFDQVRFRYPSASEVSLRSLESIALPQPERADDSWTLRDVTFRVPAGKLTALVGPSGAGKTTITHLVPRLYDPASGAVRIGGHDLRNLTLRSVRDVVGIVTQDAHLFHDTIRANLLYARPGATEQELTEACKEARIWDLISSLPDRLDTVVGDRGYRFSGGEKQRVALARLLLKAPSVVVLDEATAHLDSESEAAIQRALKTALSGRTSLVIAHRLSTIREADQILVVDQGEIRERGTHDELLAAGQLYAELYRTQFAHQPTYAKDTHQIGKT